MRGKTASRDDRYVRGGKDKEGIFPMAQSKKQVLKTIERTCRHLHPRVEWIAFQRRRGDLLDAFGLMWGEAHDLLRELQRFHAADLQRSSDDLPPVTCQQASQLYERLQTFTQRLPSSR